MLSPTICVMKRVPKEVLKLIRYDLHFVLWSIVSSFLAL